MTNHTLALKCVRNLSETLWTAAWEFSTGLDISGSTVLMNSLLKITQELCSTCCVLKLRFSKSEWNGESTVALDLLRTYFARDGRLQINQVNRKDLIAARLHPEQYAGLIVRVGGFSDNYMRLPERSQEELLERNDLVL